MEQYLLMVEQQPHRLSGFKTWKKLLRTKTRELFLVDNFTYNRYDRHMNPSIVKLQLIDTDTQKVVVDPFENNAVINFTALGTKNLNINAITNPLSVGSVVFDLDGKLHTENFAPYDIGGDTQGHFDPWTPTVGSHKLTVTPFPEANGNGTPGTPLTIEFGVVDGITPTPPTPPTIPAFTYEGTSDIVYDGQGNFTITIKGTIQPTTA